MTTRTRGRTVPSSRADAGRGPVDLLVSRDWLCLFEHGYRGFCGESAPICEICGERIFAGIFTADGADFTDKPSRLGLSVRAATVMERVAQETCLVTRAALTEGGGGRVRLLTCAVLTEQADATHTEFSFKNVSRKGAKIAKKSHSSFFSGRSVLCELGDLARKRLPSK